MSQPEISQRCKACGASVRAGAFFCPQCGEKMGTQASAKGDAVVRDVHTTFDSLYETPITREVVEEKFSEWETATPAQEDVSPPKDVPPTRDVAALNEAELYAAAASPTVDDATPAQPPVVLDTDAARSLNATSPAQNATPLTTRQTEIESPARQRRRSVAMVEDNLRPRVEKLREASMGVIEEASEDTGLRFVLIALALFLLFLLFFFLNNVLK